MLKIIEETSSNAVPEIRLPDIPIGTTFYGRVYRYQNPRLLFRIYGGLVDLTNPRSTWMPGSGQEDHSFVKDFEVYDYRPVDIVGTVKEIQ